MSKKKGQDPQVESSLKMYLLHIYWNKALNFSQVSTSKYATRRIGSFYLVSIASQTIEMKNDLQITPWSYCASWGQIMLQICFYKKNSDWKLEMPMTNTTEPAVGCFVYLQIHLLCVPFYVLTLAVISFSSEAHHCVCGLSWLKSRKPHWII